jgi:23S rRNA-/tRNA-specific pseudouridylate synthase
VSHSSSDHVAHVVVGDEEPTVEQAIAANLKLPWVESETIPVNSNQLSPRNLLQLGAVWYMHDGAVYDSSRSEKPQRLSLKDATMKLKQEDYLRIHHTPRRFPNVYNYSWTEWRTNPSGVVIDRGNGFWVIDKPANVPVHATVDNCIENVVEQIQMQLPADAYVSIPQRLDQNTSGLFMVARSKSFAAYFANLLSTKTKHLLSVDNQQEKIANIQKGYKCLVCLITKEGSSMAERYQQLKSFDILQHFLEPSIRAPKHFSRIQVNDSWVESLLRVTHIGEPFPLLGSDAAHQLCSDLWGNRDGVPANCFGVVEVQVELLTGRTHQIRGQFTTEGYPLVGDAQYGGAIPAERRVDDGLDQYYTHSERLALRCSYLRFLDPDVVTREDGTEDMQPSNRWNEYRLDDSWWTPLLQRYKQVVGDDGDATTAEEDLGRPMKRTKLNARARSELLPPKVALSPGANKYVLIKAMTTDTDQTLWFVKSSSSAECGGPYHANVAKDLVETLEALDYTVEVTGGGRIDYNHVKKYANVYGFSYGFGKGDHAKTAAIIEQHSDIFATFDNSASLY